MNPKPSSQVVLEGLAREGGGKRAARSLRREGWIPGIVYGEKEPSVSIRVGAKGFSKILRTKAGGNVLITLKLKEELQGRGERRLKEGSVLIKELQHHPVSHQIIHVDFHRVSLTKRITVTVPLVFKGEPLGVRQEGGILEHLRWDLQVECLPTEIPPEILVEVSGLSLGKTLLVKAVSLPPGIRLITDPELPVAACVLPKKEEALPAAEAPAEAAEPEVLKQKKPEEIAAEEAEEKSKEKAKEKEKAKAQQKPQEQKG